ncbi:MAG: hypothetical protein ACI8Y7_000635 [Candidatus Woesearchaeota archaeon]|jgi:hypothetical protein
MKHARTIEWLAALLLFAMASYMKLTANPQIVEVFTSVGMEPFG